MPVLGCTGCRFWSHMVAHAIGDEPMKALCLNRGCPHHGQMVHKGCANFVGGRAIDDPDMPQNPKSRPFTRLAAKMLGGEALSNLDAGKCPTCGKPIGEFKDALSRKEFGISGMCQQCQDGVFG